MRIAIVRHGQTNWNKERRIQGQTDVPLNEVGRQQSARAAEVLAAQTRFTSEAKPMIVSSPLKRTRETAAIIHGKLTSAGLNLGAQTGLEGSGGLEEPEIELDEELVERYFGAAEGLPVDEAKKTWPNLEVPDAESRDELAERSAKALSDFVQFAPGMIVVSHGAWIRAGLKRLTGADIPRVLNGEVWILEAHGDGENLKFTAESLGPETEER